jgi:hypothetical protein
LSDRAAADSDEVTDGVMLDDDAAGVLVGIDVQHASERTDLARLSVSHLPTPSALPDDWLVQVPNEVALLSGDSHDTSD